LECCPIVTTEDHRIASENLIETYFALGSACSSARVVQEQGFRLCTSAVDHPISNFAADLDLDANGAQRLSVLAAHHPSLHVYLLPGDRPKHAAELLRCAGFRPAHTLSQMVWRPRPAEVSLTALEMKEADTRRARDSVASFMAEQFFFTQKGSFRRRVTEATAGATHLKLLSFAERSKIVGAVMLCETKTTIGVYNLCVAASLRNRGWGSEIVRSAKHLASKAGNPLVLQCDANLEGWYRSLGFETAGVVEVYSLASATRADIMH
jgi:ribosomal protein S18 acetylase RimI-like enzyme